MKSETKSSLEMKVDLLLGLFQDMKEQISAPDPLRKRWLSTSDVGASVGRSGRTISNWIQQGRFPQELIKKVKRGSGYVIRLDGQDALDAAQRILLGELI